MNIDIETSLAAWLRSLPAFDGVPVHTGQSADPIPADQPVLIVGVDSTEVLTGNLYKTTASVVLATPAIQEGALEAHSPLSSALRNSLLTATLMDAAFPPSITLAGAVLTAISESRDSDRWLTTANLTLGLIAEI